MIRKVAEEFWAEVMGFDNMERHMFFVVGGVNQDLLLELFTIEYVDSYKYLVVTITKSGTTETGIKNHIFLYTERENEQQNN